MGSRLTVDIKETDDISFVTLVGVIDEDNDLTEVTPRITKSTVVINTSNVERINSCGVRDWVNWLGEIGGKGASYCFVECAPAIMAQVNSVNNFVGDGSIVSFFAPYYCASCEKDKILLIDVNEALQTKPFTTPVCRCDECDQQMEFDELESSYFEFLNSKKTGAVDAKLLEAINRFSSDSSRLRSRVTGSIPLVGVSTTPTGSGPGTTPSSKQLMGMLTNANLEMGNVESSQQPRAVPKKMLYLILSMLFVAVALLVYVALRAL